MIEHILYGGKVKLLFDPEKHIYTVDGTIIPGVTGITSIGSSDKTGALMGWVAKMCGEYAENNLKPGEALDEITKKQFIQSMKQSYKLRSSEAASIGDLVHGYVEGVIKFKLGQGPQPKRPVNEKSNVCIDRFSEWFKQHEVKFHSSERKVLSVLHGFAGTCDIDATVDGKRAIIDIKTSNRISPEYFAQIAAYRHCIEEEDNVTFDAGHILRIPKDGTEFQSVEQTDYESDMSAFLAMLKLRHWLDRFKDQEKRNGK